LNLPPWQERRQQRRVRARSGYTSLRVTKKTREKVEELRRELVGDVATDELLFHLATQALEALRKA
jgi:hypothetical protein